MFKIKRYEFNNKALGLENNMPQIEVNDQKIVYALRRSLRARKMNITIKSDGQVTATLPYYGSVKVLEDFIKSKASLILKKIAAFQMRPKITVPGGEKDYANQKKAAAIFVRDRVELYNKFYQFKYAKIAIRNQSSRWGSCSQAGNLNFNYKLIYLPPALADYIVVHELCHLQEFNHSKRFWILVAQATPNYLELRKELKKIHISIK